MSGDDASNPLAPEIANPLPPANKPSRPNLSNDDFRKLLATPRAGGGVHATPSRGGGGGGGGKGGGGGGEFKKPKPKPRTKPTTDEPEGPTYRDRAKERRNETNADYEGDRGGAALEGVRGGVPGISQQEELRQLSIEESKFLGGDVEHTHLVKGLDFALLKKVRAEIRESEKDDKFEQQQTKEKARVVTRVAEPSSAAAACPFAAPDEDFLTEEGKPAVFHSDMARNVFAFLKKERRRENGEVFVNEKFASGRMSYTFDLSGDQPQMPTTTMRSKDDPRVLAKQRPEKMYNCWEDADILTKAAACIKKNREEREKLGADGGKKMRKKEARLAAEAELERLRAASEKPSKPAAADSDDEDIFGDAGRDYEPTVSKKTTADGDGGKAASYFGGGDAKGEASIAPRTAKSAATDAEKRPTEDGEVDAGGVAVDADGFVGPMPAPPAPDFKSIDAFKKCYDEYVAAGTVRDEDGARTRWDPNAAGTYLQTCPDFALAIAANSVNIQRDREQAAADEEAKRGGAKKEKLTLKHAPPKDAATLKLELERRAEASLAHDDGYNECYVGGSSYADAVYESESDEDGKKKKTDDDADAGDARKGGKGGLGSTGKGGKMSIKAMEAQRDQKINSELGKVKKAMKEKYGEAANKLDVAFEEEGSAKAKKRDGDEEGEVDGGRRGKRLKI